MQESSNYLNQRDTEEIQVPVCCPTSRSHHWPAVQSAAPARYHSSFPLLHTLILISCAGEPRRAGLRRLPCRSPHGARRSPPLPDVAVAARPSPPLLPDVAIKLAAATTAAANAEVAATVAGAWLVRATTAMALHFRGLCRHRGGAPGNSYRGGGIIQRCTVSKHSAAFQRAVPRWCASGDERCAFSKRIFQNDKNVLRLRLITAEKHRLRSRKGGWWAK